MRITPLDIRKQEFRKAMRGLDAEEVYAFLSTIGDEYEAVLNDNKALRERVLELDDKVHEYRSMEKTLRDTLLTAERVTVETRNNARREADLIVKEAQIEAEKALRDINSQAMALRQDVSKLRNQRESYFGRMRVIAESLLKFIGSIEDDFQKEDDALKEQIPEDVTRGETALADPPPENGDLFNPADAAKQDVGQNTHRDAAPEAGRDEVPIPREDTQASSADEPLTLPDLSIEDVPSMEDSPGDNEPPVRAEPDPPVSVAGTPAGGSVEPHGSVGTATTVSASAPAAGVAPASEASKRPTIAAGDETQSAMSDIKDIIERMEDGQQRILHETRQAPSAAPSRAEPKVLSPVSAGIAAGDPRFETVPPSAQTPSGVALEKGKALSAAGDDKNRDVPLENVWERVSELDAETPRPAEAPKMAANAPQKPADKDVRPAPAKPVDSSVTSEMSFAEIRKSLESRLSGDSEKNR